MMPERRHLKGLSDEEYDAGKARQDRWLNAWLVLCGEVEAEHGYKVSKEYSHDQRMDIEGRMRDEIMKRWNKVRVQ
jgi:hypothetical protein